MLTEESIRKNFILVYELLDEMIVGATLRAPRPLPCLRRWRPGARCIAAVPHPRASSNRAQCACSHSLVPARNEAPLFARVFDVFA